MNWKWWLLVVSLEVFLGGLAFADKKEKEWPPMPPLDSLVGDTTGAITIKDSALIPTFGIYPVEGWGKTIYIDTNTFKKFGLMIFFDPWDEFSQKLVRAMGKVKENFKKKWGFDVYLVACRMSVVSCQKLNGKRPTWLCRIFLKSDFGGVRNFPDSVQKILIKSNPAFPVYRLREPLCYIHAASAHFVPAMLTAKGKYVCVVQSNRENSFPSFLDYKLVWELAFSATSQSVEDWKYEQNKGGDKK